VRFSASRSCLRRRIFFALCCDNLRNKSYCSINRRTSSSSVSSSSLLRRSRIFRNLSYSGTDSFTSQSLWYPLRTHSEQRPDLGPTMHFSLGSLGLTLAFRQRVQGGISNPVALISASRRRRLSLAAEAIRKT
jgi:hypothetical protein